MQRVHIDGLVPDSSANALGGRFKNAYEPINLRAPKLSILNKNCLFQCMGKIFYVGFQSVL